MQNKYFKALGLFGGLMVSNLLVAQSNFSDPNASHRKRTPVSVENFGNNVNRTQTVSITALNGYIPGSTSTVLFSLEYASLDLDYGDSLAITFPTGITPVAVGSSDPIVTATEGQGSEALNGVFGQTITWGDNDNNYGGIEPGTHTFQVQVTAGAGVTGPQTLTFELSSDEYSGVPPYTSTGTIVLNETTGPDLVLDSFSIDNRYYATPLAHAEPVNVTSTFLNFGTDVTAAANATYEVSGLGITGSEPFTTPFANGTSQTVSFSSAITPTSVGAHPIILNTDLTSDVNPSNNVDTTGFVITDSTMAHDNGTLAGNFSIGSGSAGILGSVYTSVVTDTITSVTFYLADPLSTDSLGLVFYEAAGGTPSTLIQAVPVSIDNGATAGMFTVPVNIPLTAGQQVLIGIEEGNATDMNVGYTTVGFENNTHYAFFQGSWLPVESAGFFYVFLVRPNFGELSGSVGNPNDTCIASFTHNVGSLDVAFTDASSYNGAGTLSYSWDFSDGSTSIDQNPIYTFADSGTYNVCLSITDGGTCSDQFCDDVVITTPSGISNISDSELSIYPNPTSNVLNIRLDGNFHVEVYNLLGAVVAERNYNSFAELDLSNNPAGVYVVKITDSIGRTTTKQIQKTK